MRVMMKWAARVLFWLVGAFLVWFGYVYLTAPALLSFHAAAVPEGAREAVRPIYFALMNLVGGASLALGALGLFVTATAIAAGSRIAALAVASAYAFSFVVAAATAEELALSGAPTSWHIMGVLLAMTGLGLALHFAAHRGAARR